MVDKEKGMIENYKYGTAFFWAPVKSCLESTGQRD